jgi:glycolate oxidase FAD binding subunit
VLDALVDICGPDFARAARSVDTVAGRRAGHVAVPATAQAVAAVLRLAADNGLTAVPRGSGSKLDWGVPPPGVDLLVDTARLGGLWHHDVAAGIATVGTGTPVGALQAALALHGQRLPVDPPSLSATVGGMLATNESGPLRFAFGTPAEHVDRVAYIDADAMPGESDGEQGRPGLAEITGVITAATVRLQRLPEARRWVGVALSSPARARELLQAALADPERLSAVEMDLPSGGRGTLAALYEGDEVAVVERSERLAAAWGSGTVTTPIAPPWWGRYPFGRTDVALRLSVPVFDLPFVVYTLGDAAGVPVAVRGSAGLGSAHVALPGSLAPERLDQVLEALHHVLMARDGQVVVVAAPPALASRVDMATRAELF